MPHEATLSDLEVLTEPLGGDPLSVAASRGDAPEAWYVARPTTSAAWLRRAREIQPEGGPAWLSELEPAIAPSGAAAARLSRVAGGRGVVVTTGQQPGLFGGPVYTFSKALSALALADELEARTGIPVAPVFWAATDDADFDEAKWTKVVLDARVVRLEAHAAPPAGTLMSVAPLGDVSEELRELERASGSAAFGPALDAARRAYGPGATVGGAFVALLRALLEPLGIAVLDASHPSVRRRGADVLYGALKRSAAIAAALHGRANELRAANFEPQVAEMEDLSLVFSIRDGIKRRIPIAEARSAGVADPATLGPNVLLRPVLERDVLPTVAYVAGPAELAYFAQVSAVADALGAERPLAVPRWSVTIVEPHVARILARLGVGSPELRDPHALEGSLARAALPEAVVSALAQVRETVERAVAPLATNPDAARLIPPAAATGARAALLARLERLERRYVAAVKRREAELMGQLAAARAHLYPDGRRQERALNFVPMLARQGPPLLDAMRTAAASHAAALVGPEGPATPPSGRAEAAQGRASP